MTNEGKQKEDDKVKLNLRVGRSMGDHEYIAKNGLLKAMIPIVIIIIVVAIAVTKNI